MKTTTIRAIFSAAFALGVGASAVHAEEAASPMAGLSNPFSNMGNIEFTDRFSVTPSIGTLGYGLEASYKMSDKFKVRGAYRTMGHEGDYEIEGEDFNLDVDLTTAGVMMDFHPTQGAFRITAGALKNNMEASLDGSYNGTFTFDGQTYSDPEATNVSGSIDFPSVAPVLSIGWDKAVTKHFSITAEFGAMFMGAGTLDLTASGGAADQAQFQEALARERDNIQEDLDKFKVYPIAQIGASFKF